MKDLIGFLIIGISPFVLFGLGIIVVKIISVVFFNVSKTGEFLGKIKVRRKLKKEIEKINLDNPYKYFREIPNQYGIGVAAYILNYDIEKIDVIAAVLDLCAKGYLKLKKDGKSYSFVNNNKNTDALLENEKYVLNWVLNNNKFDLNKFLNLCKQDCINLELIQPTKEYSHEISNRKLIMGIIIFTIIVALILNYFNMSFFWIFLSFPIAILIFMSLEVLKETYIKQFKERPKLTELGKKEYYELYSLAKFINDFGNFADKHIQEIVIWEQYLSYAILFRLSDKVLKDDYKNIHMNKAFTFNYLEELNEVVSWK